MKAASKETVSPSGFVTETRCAPEVIAGVTTVRVFISLKMTEAVFPPIMIVEPF